jgi:hypothetical protein
MNCEMMDVDTTPKDHLESFDDCDDDDNNNNNIDVVDVVFFHNKGILFHMVGYLSFSEARLFLGSTCKALKLQHQQEYEQQITSLTLQSNTEVKNSLCLHRLYRRHSHNELQPSHNNNNYNNASTIIIDASMNNKLWTSLTSNLVKLNVGSYGSDIMLQNLRTSQCTSTLKSLCMVGSVQHLTDVGLWYLGNGVDDAAADADSSTTTSTTTTMPTVEDVHTQFLNTTVEQYYHHTSPFQSLEEIDITFCRRTTYIGTYFVRDGLPKLKLLHRAPKWLCGHFITPFGNTSNTNNSNNNNNNRVGGGEPPRGEGGGGGSEDINENGNGEVHTYWVDGSFSFTRDAQSSGFVRDLWSWKKNGGRGSGNSSGRDDGDDDDDDYNDDCRFVGNKMQYNRVNDEEPMSLAYRPGVSLLRLPPQVVQSGGGKDDGTATSSTRTVECVLVVQNLKGLKPPDKLSWMEQCKDIVAIGQTKFFYCERNSDGVGDRLIETRPPTDFPPPEESPTITRHPEYPIVLISKMKVEPLSGSGSGDNRMMPPRDLVEANRAICKYEVGKVQRLNDLEGMIQQLMEQAL